MASKEYLILIIYDISDNKNRAKMVKLLERYGIRVQRSAFEAKLRKRPYQKLRKKAQYYIDEETDSLRFYCIEHPETVKSYGIGIKQTPNCIII